MRKLPVLPRQARDPRLLLGLLLVAGGGVAGAYVLGGDDDIEVLRAVETVPRGDVVERASFESLTVPSAVAGHYLSPSQFETGSIAVTTIHPGDLLAPHALADEERGVVVVIPLAVPAASNVRVGSTVEVWRISEAGYTGEAQASKLAGGAVVHRLDNEASFIDGSVSAEVMIDPNELELILSVMGTADSFALVGVGQ